MVALARGSGFASSCVRSIMAFFTQRELAQRVNRVCKHWNRVIVQSPELWRTWIFNEKRQPPIRSLMFDPIDFSLKALRPYLLPLESLAFVKRIEMNGADPFALLPFIAHVHEIVGGAVVDLCHRYTDEEMARKASPTTLSWQTLTMCVYQNHGVTSTFPPMPLLEHLHLQVQHNCTGILHLKLSSRRLKSFGLCGFRTDGQSCLRLEWIDWIDWIDSKSFKQQQAITFPMLTDLCFTPNTLAVLTDRGKTPKKNHQWPKDCHPMRELFLTSASTLTRLIVRPFSKDNKRYEDHHPCNPFVPIWSMVLRLCPNLEHLELHDPLNPFVSIDIDDEGAKVKDPREWPFASTLRILTLCPSPKAMANLDDWFPVSDALPSLQVLTFLGASSSSSTSSLVLPNLKARNVTVIVVPSS